jgi:hypothetical protein
MERSSCFKERAAGSSWYPAKRIGTSLAREGFRLGVDVSRRSTV